MRIVASFAAVVTVATSLGARSPAAEAQAYLAAAPSHFLFHGKTYCFSPAGWAGRGWYVCGFAQRRGYGYGGPVGFADAPASGSYGPAYGYGQARFYGAYGGFHRGHGWQRHDGWQHGHGPRHGFDYGGFGVPFHHPMGHRGFRHFSHPTAVGSTTSEERTATPCATTAESCAESRSGGTIDPAVRLQLVGNVPATSTGSSR